MAVIVEPKVLGVLVGGPPGDTGGQGVPGPGVPVGGLLGQALLKFGAGDFNTGWEWVVNTVAGKAGDVTLEKADVGLDNVDNTADADKPVSTAVAAAIATLAPLESPSFTGTVSGITKAMVGLGNVNNTADAAKPVSTAQQAALDTKAPLNSPTFTGTVGGLDKSMVGLSNVDNTADANKPLSTATIAALNLRAPKDNPQFTGTVGGITAAMVGLGNVNNTADLDKPISTATAASIATRAPLNAPQFTGQVGGITKDMVGLGAVDNTADNAKPVSGPQQAAIALRAPINNPTFTGTVGGITPAMVGLANVNNTADADKPISTAVAAALATKVNSNNPSFSGTVTGISKSMVGLGNVDNTADADKPLSAATVNALNQVVAMIPNQVSLAGLAPINNPTFTGTVGGITKSMVGLGFVDNTADASKPVSIAQQAALDTKAPINNPTFTGVVGGITKETVGLGNVDNTSDANKPLSVATIAALNLRAPKDSPQFTGTVSGISASMVGLGSVDNTADANKPVSTAQAAAIATRAPINNPTFTGNVVGIDKSMVGLSNVDNTADALKPVSNLMQAALALRAPINNPTFTGTVGGITPVMVGLGNVDNTADSAKPVSLAQQAALDLKANRNNPSFTGTATGLTKSMVGLANVDNTADADKPISTAVAAALALKVSANSPTFTGTVAGITKAMVGLANVDNTADADKPISTATAAALASKASLVSPQFTGTVGGITATMVGLGNVNNTADAAKPVSAPQQAALDLKANLNNPTFTGTVGGITKTMVGLGLVDNTADISKPVSTAQAAALALKIDTSRLGTAGGVATLGNDGKLTPAQLPASVGGGWTYLGNWDASTNQPVLQSSNGPFNGAYYTVSVGGTVPIDGVTNWTVGDKIVFNGTKWERFVGGASGGDVQSVAGKSGVVTLVKADVGLALVDNTADVNKPVSTAQAAALAGKAPLDNPTFTGTVGGITKGMVGLSAVDNTADAAKPVSGPQAAALGLKANIANPTFTGTVGGISKAMVGLGAVDNTADADKPISTAQSAALAGKAPVNNPAFTGTVTGITKAMVGLGNVDNTADADKPVSTAQAVASASKVSKAGDSMSGGLNFARTTLASSPASSDIWAGGNQIDFSGSAVVTNFPAAPQAGAQRTLILGGNAQFLASPSMLIEGIPSGGTFQGTTYDEVTVRALSTTLFKLSINKYDGTPVAGGSGTGDVTLAGVQALSNKTLINPTAQSQTLTDAALVTWNANLGQDATVVIGGNRTIALPTNMKKGSIYTLHVQQDGTGSRNYGFAPGYNHTVAPTISTSANAVDTYLYVSDGVGLHGMQLSRVGSGAAPAPTPAPTPTPAPSPTPAPAPAGALGMGTNLSGMEWVDTSIRFGQSTAPNINITIPRTADVDYLAFTGMSKTRLPIRWEMLQPVLAGSNANAAVLSAHGIAAAGAFNPIYEGYITALLDAHAAAGLKMIIDCHNYCRYVDFIYNVDGSVTSFTDPADALVMPYTTDNTKVQTRIMSKYTGTGGPSLTQAHFNDFWTRVANKWKGHAGLAGYGLMNEPHDMPTSTSLTAWNNPYVNGNVQDLTIWPTYAQGAINAIRATGATEPIYVSGNNYSSAVDFPTANPGYPLTGTNLIYEAHMYLDASSAGQAFDYTLEVNKGFSVGESGAINAQTGVNRLAYFVNWLSANGGLKGALGEFGMPLGDTRWTTMYKNAIAYLIANNVEIYTWMGGNHWPIHGYPINHVPQFAQNKTLEPEVSGVLRAGRNVAQYAVFDEVDTAYALAGGVCTITVWARGSLTSPLTINVASNNGGTLSKTVLTLAAGANSRDTFTYTTASDRVATLTYSGSLSLPPPRKIYSLIDPVTYASTSLPDAAGALLAKYKAAKWEAGNAYTDYMNGVAATAGSDVRAISDSGGSALGVTNPMEMIHWFNTAGNQENQPPAKYAVDSNGRAVLDLTVYPRRGLWCKKTMPEAGTSPTPQQRMPFDAHTPHFMIGVCSIVGTTGGTLMQAGRPEGGENSSISFSSGRPVAVFKDVNGLTTTISGSTALTANLPHVLTAKSKPTAQLFRVDGSQIGTGANTFSVSPFNQLLIGGGYPWYYPEASFLGYFYGGIAGPGDPTVAELTVLENYLLSLANSTLSPPAPTPAPAPSIGGIGDLFAAGQEGGWWDAADASSLKQNSDATGAATIDPFVQIGYMGDKSGRGHHLKETVDGNRPGYWLESSRYYLGLFDNMLAADGGGSTTGWFVGMAVRLESGYYNILFTDSTATTNGLLIRYNGDDSAVRASIGTASSTTQALRPGAQAAMGYGVDAVVMAWYDGTTLSVQVNDGPAVSATVGAMQAGGPQLSLGGSVTDADIMFGRFHRGVYRKNSALTSTERNFVLTQLGASIGVSLGAAPAPSPTPAPTPAPGPTPAPAPGVAAYPFAARTDFPSGYGRGLKPTNYTQTQMDNYCKSQYTSWKNARIKGMYTVTSHPNSIYAGAQVAGVYYDQFSDPAAAYVSEGMGYAMLLTVIFAGYDTNAQAVFDGMFKFGRARPAYGMGTQGKYLMEWKVKADLTSINDGYNAADGDLDMALALLMAHRQWGSAGSINYLQEAKNTIGALKALCFAGTPTAAVGVMSVGIHGPVGNQHTMSRTSDYMYDHFRQFATATGDAFWTTGVTNSQAMIQTVINGYSASAKLTPDWIIDIETSTPKPSTGDLMESPNEGQYFFNAMRNPWRWATHYLMTGNATSRAHAGGIVQTIVNEADPIATGVGVSFSEWLPNYYTLSGAGQGSRNRNIVMGSALGCGACCGVNANDQTRANTVMSTLVTNPGTGYYDTELQLLAMVLMSGNWWTYA